MMQQTLKLLILMAVAALIVGCSERSDGTADDANLSDYLQELRLEYSTLLMSTRPDVSISQIALDCGFSSYAYYGKCFRRRFGMTPTEFRQSAEQKQ